MRFGVGISVAMHLGIGVLAWIELPHLARDLPAPETLMVVDLVTVAEATSRPPPEPPKPEPEPAAPEPPPPPEPAPPAPAPPEPAPPEPAKPQPPQPEPPDPVPAPPQPPPTPEPAVERAPERPSAKPLQRPSPPAKRPEVTPPEVTPPTPRDQEARFARLLKSVEAISREPPPPSPPQPEPAAADRLLAAARDAARTPLDRSSPLSNSEIAAVRQQIAQCWNVPAGAKDAGELVVELKLRMNPDATVRAAAVVDRDRMARDQFFRTAAESAVRAVLNPKCSPLRLPLDKYEIWKTLTIGFNPKDIIG